MEYLELFCEHYCLNNIVNINNSTVLNITVNTTLNITFSVFLFVHIELRNIPKKLKLMKKKLEMLFEKVIGP